MNGRANKGGEVGLNGERYEGGQFLPSSENTVKGALKATIRKGTKSEVAPYTWQASPADDMLSIYDRISYLCTDNRRECEYKQGFNGLKLTVNKQSVNLTSDGIQPWSDFFENLYQWAVSLAEKFNNGERWFSLSDDPYHYKNQNH